MWEQFLESLLNLILQYKLSGDDEILCEILKRLDGWIITVIVSLKKSWRYLEAVSLNDLYQTAVVGVLVMISRLPKDEPSVKLAQRVKSYSICEIRKTYGKYWYEVPVSQLCDEISDDYIFVEPCENIRIELEVSDFYLNLFPRLTGLGVITEKEYRCLNAYYIVGLLHKDIAKQEGFTRSRVTQVINEARQKIKRYMIC